MHVYVKLVKHSGFVSFGHSLDPFVYLTLCAIVLRAWSVVYLFNCLVSHNYRPIYVGRYKRVARPDVIGVPVSSCVPAILHVIRHHNRPTEDLYDTKSYIQWCQLTKPRTCVWPILHVHPKNKQGNVVETIWKSYSLGSSQRYSFKFQLQSPVYVLGCTPKICQKHMFS